MYANINVKKTKGFKCQTVVLSNLAFFTIPTQNECFGGYTRISLSVRPSLCPYVCVSVCPSVYKILVSVKALAGVLVAA